MSGIENADNSQMSLLEKRAKRLAKSSMIDGDASSKNKFEIPSPEEIDCGHIFFPDLACESRDGFPSGFELRTSFSPVADDADELRELPILGGKGNLAIDDYQNDKGSLIQPVEYVDSQTEVHDNSCHETDTLLDPYCIENKSTKGVDNQNQELKYKTSNILERYEETRSLPSNNHYTNSIDIETECEAAEVNEDKISDDPKIETKAKQHSSRKNDSSCTSENASAGTEACKVVLDSSTSLDLEISSFGDHDLPEIKRKLTAGGHKDTDNDSSDTKKVMLDVETKCEKIESFSLDTRSKDEPSSSLLSDTEIDDAENTCYSDTSRLFQSSNDLPIPTCNFFPIKEGNDKTTEELFPSHTLNKREASHDSLESSSKLPTAALLFQADNTGLFDDNSNHAGFQPYWSERQSAIDDIPDGNQAENWAQIRRGEEQDENLVHPSNYLQKESIYKDNVCNEAEYNPNNMDYNMAEQISTTNIEYHQKQTHQEFHQVDTDGPMSENYSYTSGHGQHLPPAQDTMPYPDENFSNYSEYNALPDATNQSSLNNQVWHNGGDQLPCSEYVTQNQSMYTDQSSNGNLFSYSEYNNNYNESGYQQYMQQTPQIADPTSWKVMEPPRYCNLPMREEQSQPTEIHNSEVTIKSFAETQKELSNNDQCRLRPAHAIATFGFGGKLCVMFPKETVSLLGHFSPATQGPEKLSSEKKHMRKGPVNLWKFHLLTQSTSLAALPDEISVYPGPFLSSKEDFVQNYITNKMSEFPPNVNSDLWRLIDMVSKYPGGRLHSYENNSPQQNFECAISAFLCENAIIANPCSTNAPPAPDASTQMWSLQDIQDLLLAGKTHKAVDKAINDNQFALALLIAPLCSQIKYQEAVSAFVNSTLASGSPLHTMTNIISGRQQSFNDAAESEDLGMTAFNSSDVDLSQNWRSNLAILLKNRGPGWKLSAAELGRTLLCGKNKNVNAAHFCYVACSEIGRFNPPSWLSPFVLLGIENEVLKATSLQSSCALQAFQLTEAFEWAFCETDKKNCFPALQPYKLEFAMLLADQGLFVNARKYVKSIWECVNSMADKNMFSSSFLDDLSLFEERIDSILGIIDPYKSYVNGKLLSRCKEKDHSRLSTIKGEILNAMNLVTFGKGECTDKENEDSPENKQSESKEEVKLDSKIAQEKEHETSDPKNDAPLSLIRKEVDDGVIVDLLSDDIDQIFITEVQDVAYNKKVTASDQVSPQNTDLVKKKLHEITLKSEKDKKNIPHKKSPQKSTADENKTKVPENKGWGITNWVSKRLISNGVKRADVGNPLEAYYDDTLKRWIFPGEDNNGVSNEPPPPPPTNNDQNDNNQTSLSDSSIGSNNDAIGSLIAPPKHFIHSRENPGKISGSSNLTGSNPGTKKIWNPMAPLKIKQKQIENSNHNEESASAVVLEKSGKIISSDTEDTNPEKKNKKETNDHSSKQVWSPVAHNNGNLESTNALEQAATLKVKAYNSRSDENAAFASKECSISKKSSLHDVNLVQNQVLEPDSPSKDSHEHTYCSDMI